MAFTETPQGLMLPHWDRGRMKYSISQNGFGDWWPLLSYHGPEKGVGEFKTNPYPVIIRNSNPFKTQARAVQFIEKHIARMDARKKEG